MEQKRQIKILYLLHSVRSCVFHLVSGKCSHCVVAVTISSEEARRGKGRVRERKREREIYSFKLFPWFLILVIITVLALTSALRVPAISLTTSSFPCFAAQCKAVWNRIEKESKISMRIAHFKRIAWHDFNAMSWCEFVIRIFNHHRNDFSNSKNKF